MSFDSTQVQALRHQYVHTYVYSHHLVSSIAWGNDMQAIFSQQDMLAVANLTMEALQLIFFCFSALGT